MADELHNQLERAAGPAPGPLDFDGVVRRARRQSATRLAAGVAAVVGIAAIAASVWTAGAPQPPAIVDRPQSATTPVAHYPLEDGYQSSVDGAPDLRVVGKVELVADNDASGATAAAFGSNSGFSLDTSDLVDPEVYTLAFRFRLDTESTRPDAWFKLVDFRERKSDTGFYVHEESFQFFRYPPHEGAAPIGDAPYATVVLRRSADGKIAWFVDGEHQATVDDSETGYGWSEDGVIDGGTLHFFLDDTVSGHNEQSPGRVAWLSVYDRALDDDTIAEL